MNKSGEWYQWQPNGQAEAADWPEFLQWCDQWGKWLSVVPTRKIEKGQDDSEPRRPAWHARVYGGKK